MRENDTTRPHERWAHVRFAVVGPLLAAPPPRGELGVSIEGLAQKEWKHPITGLPVYFGASTIERWYYAALHARRDPVGVLRREIRDDAGIVRRINGKLRQKLIEQYDRYKSWGYLLHYDNLVALAERDADLHPLPSYATVRRFMKSHGLFRVRRPLGGERPGAIAARAIAAQREIRSFESEFVSGLWHLDFHSGSRKVLTAQGTWETPHLLCILDDHSRLVRLVVAPCQRRPVLAEIRHRTCGLGYLGGLSARVRATVRLAQPIVRDTARTSRSSARGP